MSGRLLRILLLPLSIAASPAAAGEETLGAVHLDRRPAVGSRFTVAATGVQTRRSETVQPDEPREITDDSLEIIYAGIHEVKAIDKKGRPTELLLRVDRLVTNDGSGPQEQFPAGTLIQAKLDGETTRYRLGREELEGTLSDALNLAGAKLPPPDEASEDAVFLNEKFPVRKKGECWNADSLRLAEAMAATGPFTIDPVTSSAEIRVDGAQTEHGIPSLLTTTRFRIIPMAWRAPETAATLRESLLTVTMERLLPLDPGLPLLRETLDTTMKLSTSSKPGGRSTDSTAVMTRKVTRRYLPLPAE